MHAVTSDQVIALFTGQPVDGVLNRKPKIEYRFAVFTDEMIMRSGNRVEMFGTVSEIPAAQSSFLHENADIPVQVSETQLGYFRSQFFKDLIGSGVGIGSADKIQNLFSLNAFFSGFHFKNIS